MKCGEFNGLMCMMSSLLLFCVCVLWMMWFMVVCVLFLWVLGMVFFRLMEIVFVGLVRVLVNSFLWMLGMNSLLCMDECG